MDHNGGTSPNIHNIENTYLFVISYSDFSAPTNWTDDILN